MDEIIMTEEVMETAEETTTGKTGNGLKIATGIGIATAVSVLAYKFVVKPIAKKIKAKKEAAKVDANVKVIDSGNDESSETTNG
jgi:hypothetical protein